MKQTIVFWKKIAAQAFQETAFLARNKMLYGAGVGTAALVIQGEFGLHPWTNIVEIVVSLILAYVLVALLSLGCKFLSVPAIIYSEQQRIVKGYEEEKRTRQETLKDAKPFLWLSAASVASQLLTIRRQHQSGGYSEGLIPITPLTLTVHNDCPARISTLRLRIHAVGEEVIDHRTPLSSGQQTGIEVTRATLRAICGSGPDENIPNLNYGQYKVQMKLEYKNDLGEDRLAIEGKTISICEEAGSHFSQISFKIDG